MRPRKLHIGEKVVAVILVVFAAINFGFWQKDPSAGLFMLLLLLLCNLLWGRD